MSKGNWRKFVATHGGLIASFFLGAVFCLVVIEITWLGQADLYSDASRHSVYYAERADNEIALKCARLPRQAYRDCAEPIEDAARSNQRNEYDLYAQTAVARWTSIMGGMAVLGVALSGAGLWAILRTIRQGQSALDAARDANKTSSDEFRQAYKPFLHVELFGPIVDPATPRATGKKRIVGYRVGVRVTNRSQAVAKILFYRISSYEDFKAGGIIPLMPIDAVLEHRQSTFLATPEANRRFKTPTLDIEGMGPTERFDFMRREEISSQFHSETIDYGADVPRSPAIVVRIFYEDALGVRRIINRCYAATNDKRDAAFYECGGTLVNYEKEEK